MQPPFPSATPTWHNETYASISRKRPELSAKGKTVVITGASGGISRETAISFAAAGASKLVLLDRDGDKLKETVSLLPSGINVSTHVVDIKDGPALKEVADSVRNWDVLILGAAYFSKPSTVADSDPDEWWESFEVNVKGTFLTLKAFLPFAGETRPVVLSLVSGVIALTPSMLPGFGAYTASKIALTNMIEFVAAEEPRIFVANVHPGIVMTTLMEKAGASSDQMVMDNVNLSADFNVWMASPEANFLRGRLAWANWDVEELKKQAESIQGGNLFTSGINGWPFLTHD